MERISMPAFRRVAFAMSWIVWIGIASLPLRGETSIPDIPTLLREAQEHQRALDKVRENYTYREHQQVDELDSDGHLKKSETEDREIFYVNAHPIARVVAKNGKALSDNDQKKEQEHVNKEVEKATRTPPGQSLDHDTVSITRLLEIMKASNPRRVMLHGRESFSFDFSGNPDAKTHGISEDAAKKISGTLWIDAKDRQVARMEAHFDDNFRVAGGLVASVQKGSTFMFEQAIVNNELWLPTSAQVHLGARVLLFKSVRQNITVTVSDYQRFHTDAQQLPDAKVTTPNNQDKQKNY
jgi:hypothetical protein